MQTIQAIRRSRRLTIVDVALLSGIPARTLGAIECGTHQIDMTTRAALAHVFGMAPTAVCGPLDTGRAAPGRSTLHPDVMPRYARLRRVAPAAAAGLATALLLAPLMQRLAAPPAAILQQSVPTAIAVTIPRPAQRRAPSAAATAAATPAVRGLIDTIAEPAPLAVRGELVRSEDTQAGVYVGQKGSPLPHGCPVRAAGVVITQGYDEGTHSPAAIWGGLDFAVDSDGDGYTEPGNTRDQPLIATHDGTASVYANSWPGGNYVRITNAATGWAVAYAHLETIGVTDGQQVRAGDVIGTIGTTGMSTGPHLHYELWNNGINTDPRPVTDC